MSGHDTNLPAGDEMGYLLGVLLRRLADRREWSRTKVLQAVALVSAIVAACWFLAVGPRQIELLLIVVPVVALGAKALRGRGRPGADVRPPD